VTGRRIVYTLRLAAPPAVAGLICFALLRFPPARYTFYPQCPIYEVLHLQCPGCGGTRAIAAVLHGQFSEAMHLNALVTLLLPIAAVYCVPSYCRFVRRRPLGWHHPPAAVIFAAFAVTAVFTVIRNLAL
jgi:Protein of unknown function (DUF2752)